VDLLCYICRKQKPAQSLRRDPQNLIVANKWEHWEMPTLLVSQAASFYSCYHELHPLHIGLTSFPMRYEALSGGYRIRSSYPCE
jgi:hypothetical protein